MGLAKAGYGRSTAALQGSSVTGFSFKSGQAFDVGRVSDFDVALAGDRLYQAAIDAGVSLRGGGTRTRPLQAVDLEMLGLGGLQVELSRAAGREVNFMIFRSVDDIFARGESVLVPVR